MLTDLMIGDIIRVTKENYTTIGRVTDATDDAVEIFRVPDNVWYHFDEYEVEILESLG